MSSDFLCNVFVTKRTSSFSTHLSSISLVTHSSAFISLLKMKYCTRLVSPSKICHKLHSDYVTEAQLLVHLLWATCLPWVPDLNGYSIQSNWNVMCIIPTGAQIFFWSFLYTVEALQTDSLVSTQLYLWRPSQNLTFSTPIQTLYCYISISSQFQYCYGHLFCIPRVFTHESFHYTLSILSLEQWNVELKLWGDLK